MASYFCERTAEYLLTAKISEILRPHFRSCIPIWFWKTREGNTTSASIHKGSHLRILSIYARRPKINFKKNIVLGKINQELFEYAGTSYPSGIPVIAGFPVTRSIWELTDDAPVWLSLKKGQSESDREFYVDLSTDLAKPIGVDSLPIQILTRNEIVDLVLHESKVFPWEEAMHLIADLRIKRYHESRFYGLFGIGGYKPMHILIRDDN